MLQITPNHAKLALMSSNYKGEVLGHYAFITISQVYQNLSSQDVSLKYSFPMPKGSSLIGFEVQTGEKKIVSTVLEPSSAKEYAEKAQQAGLPEDIFIIDEDTSFSILVGKVLHNETLTIQVSYFQKLQKLYHRTRILIPSFTDLDSSDAHACSAALTLQYDSFGTIEKVDSPTHLLHVENFNTSAFIRSNEIGNVQKEYRIDIYEKDMDKPIAFQNGAYCCWNFVASFPSKRCAPCEYLFLIDCSRHIDGEKFAKIKSALRLCLKSLDKGDSFNIIGFENLCHYFSLQSLPFHPISMESAFRWLDGLKPMGDAFLSSALRHACEQPNPNKVVLLITAGDIADADNVLQLIKKHHLNHFHALCADGFSNPSFINELAKAANGFAMQQQIGQEIEEAVLSLFLKATTTGMQNFMITPNGPVSELSPKEIKKVIECETLCFAAKTPSKAPDTVLANGLLNGQSYEEGISFILRETEMDLEALFLNLRIQQLSEQITTEGTPVDLLSKRELLNLCLQNNRISPYSYPGATLHIKDAQGRLAEITVPAVLKKTPILSKETPHDICFLLLQQQENGSFGNRMQETAQAVIDIFEHAEALYLYRWHIKKSIRFLFDSIQEGNYDVLVREVIQAFAFWCEYFSEEETFTKKVEAIVYMNRDLL